LLWYVICFVSLVILVTDFISLFISHWSKLLNTIQDGIINPHHFKLEPKSIHERLQNLTLVFEACQKLGLRIVNIGPQEIIDGRVCKSWRV
jgi:hypothetical protein